MTTYTRQSRGIAIAHARAGTYTVRAIGDYWRGYRDQTPGRICARAAQAAADIGAPPLDLTEAEIRADATQLCRICGQRITYHRRDLDGGMHVETCGGRRP